MQKQRRALAHTTLVRSHEWPTYADGACVGSTADLLVDVSVTGILLLLRRL